MTTCFIKWDNSYSYKLANPDNNFSIINVQGIPQKIIWDGGGTGKEHIINNPNNYSYSIITRSYTNQCYLFLKNNVGDKFYLGGEHVFYLSNYALCFSRTEKAIVYLNENGIPVNRFGTPISFIQDTFKGCGFPYGNYGLNVDNSATLSPCYIPNDIRNVYYPINGNFYFPYPNSCYRDYNVYQTKIEIEAINPYYQLKIIDNNTTYIYSITNTNSVQIIYNQGGKKIQIEGKQFDIIDENSAYKDCDKHCPNGLIECQCGNQLCCYKKTNSGYQLVSTIKL